MNMKKTLPIFVVLPLVIAGCSPTSKKKSSKSSSTPTTEESSSVAPVSSSSETPTSASSVSPTSAPTSASSATSGTTAPVPSSSSTAPIPPVPSSSSTTAPLPPSSSSGSSSAPTPTSSSSGTPIPPDPHPAQEYLEMFNGLKANIQNNHNYTIDVHTEYIDNPGSGDHSQDMEYDDEIIMINNKVYCFNGEYTGQKTGYIYQKNQGFVSFDYFGTNILANKFYCTNPEAGITDFEDLVGENFFIGEYSQSSSDSSIFETTSMDVMAVAVNMSGWGEYAEILISPEKITVQVDITNLTLTVESHFEYFHFDEVEKHSDIHSTFTIKSIGTTSNSTFEAYIENPTTTYPVRTSWSADDEDIFHQYFAGEVPSFPAGASYAFSVEAFADEHTDPDSVLVSDRNSGDLSSSYATEILTYEGYEEITPIRENTRLFKRVLVDDSTMMKTTTTIEMGYSDPSVRYPNGRFDLLFKGKIENVTINTVQLFNTYLATKGYTSFVPQLNCSTSLTISNFSDITESKNQELEYHAYEFYTGTVPMRLHIESYSDAVSIVNAYVDSLTPYGFTEVSKDPLGKRIVYTNDERYETDSSIALTDLSKYDSSSYLGYVEISFLIYAEKDPSATDILYSIEIDPTKLNFTVGDTFSYTGTIVAWYTNANHKNLDPEDVIFSGYNLSQSGDQTVTVTYEEGGVTVHAYYDIHVSSDLNFRSEFGMFGDSFVATINLCDDGTGTHTLVRSGTPSLAGTFMQYFTYQIEGSSIEFTLTGTYSTSDFTRFSLFASAVEGAKNTGTYDEVNHTITVTLSTSSGANQNEKIYTKL